MTSLSLDMKAAKAKMNLQVLQRVDSNISKIELTFDHVVLYEFVPKKKEWKKKGVEGSSFIVQRTDNTHAFVILNRLNVENFSLDIDPSVEVEFQTPFLLVKANKKIFGMWFYREQNATQFIQYIDDNVALKPAVSAVNNATPLLTQFVPPSIPQQPHFMPHFSQQHQHLHQILPPPQPSHSGPNALEEFSRRSGFKLSYQNDNPPQQQQQATIVATNGHSYSPTNQPTVTSSGLDLSKLLTPHDLIASAQKGTKYQRPLQ